MKASKFTDSLIMSILKQAESSTPVATLYHEHSMSIRACSAFGMSGTCYRYQSKLSEDNTLITEQLFDLTEENSDRNFGRYFSYLRHVESHCWNHKQVYRILWEDYHLNYSYFDYSNPKFYVER